jgi:hypothetical protein
MNDQKTYVGWVQKEVKLLLLLWVIFVTYKGLGFGGLGFGFLG